MTGLVEKHRKLAHSTLNRVGETVELYEPTEPAENAYGKQSDTDRTFTKVGETVGLRVHESTSSVLEEAEAVGGMVDAETPKIAVPYDAAASEHWRIQFKDGRKYYLTTELPDRVAKVFRSRLVDDDAN